MTPTSHKFAGDSYGGRLTPGSDSDTHAQVPAAPAIVVCPKCSGLVSVSHKHGANRPWHYCKDRRGCGWKSPAEVAPSLPVDDGLEALKPAPVAGFDGLRGPVAMQAGEF